MTARVSQAITEVVLAVAPPRVVVTQAIVEAVIVGGYTTPGTLTGAGVTQALAEVVIAGTSSQARVRQAIVEVVCLDDTPEYDPSYPIWVG